MNEITIGLADDQEVFREGLRVVLDEAPFRIIWEAGDGKELLEKTAAHTPDIVLLDLHMPVVKGTEATRQLKQLFPGLKILVISMYADETFIRHLEALGADGYLLKNAEPENIRHAITTLFPG